MFPAACTSVVCARQLLSVSLDLNQTSSCYFFLVCFAGTEGAPSLYLGDLVDRSRRRMSSYEAEKAAQQAADALAAASETGSGRRRKGAGPLSSAERLAMLLSGDAQRVR